jgi:hypothetical protein
VAGLQKYLDEKTSPGSNGGTEHAMKTSISITVEQEAKLVLVGGAVRIARNDNDSNPSPGWDLVVFRN